MARDKCPEARNAGRDAYVVGVGMSGNPHPRGTPAHREWARGWRYSQHLADQTPKPRREHVGWEAFRLGRTLADNPYAPGDRRHSGWVCGWSRARNESVRADGFASFHANVPAENNPHTDFVDRSDWLIGWTDARNGHEQPRHIEPLFVDRGSPA